MTTEERATILVVDDTEINIDVLVEALAGDYAVRVALDGESALRSVAKALPGLILLDVMMPEMDGFEVCRRLKEVKATQDIPVIFLTALSEEEDEARGLELGAADYITKPFNPALVKARVRNHLELKRYRDHLEELVERQTHELAEAHNRLKALDAAKHDYLCAISHELRTPANGVLGVAELALLEMADGDQLDTYRALFEQARERLMSAIDGALRLAALQGGDATIKIIPVDLGAIVATTSDRLREELSKQGLSLVPPQVRPGIVLGNEELIDQSITTTLKMAQKLAIPGTSVDTRCHEEKEMVVLFIEFKGRAMPEKLERTFFDTFSSARSASYVEDLGLAVPLVADIMRAMGGSAAIRCTPSGQVIQLAFLKKDTGKE
jgi:two-component system sensor histidine kinase/response regulator